MAEMAGSGGEARAATPGAYEFFAEKVQKDENIQAVKGKVARVFEDPSSRELIVEAEDILSGRKMRVSADLVVLATGMASSLAEEAPEGVSRDRDGFVLPSEQGPGIYAAGCARGPADVATSVQDATAAALRAIQSIQQAATRH